MALSVRPEPPPGWACKEDALPPADRELVLMTVECHEAPSLEAAARTLGVAESALDADFGVVPIDPDRDLYTVRIDAAAVRKLGRGKGKYRGPFSDPKIAPMR